MEVKMLLFSARIDILRSLSLLSMLLRLFFLFMAFLGSFGMVFAESAPSDINIRDINVGDSGNYNGLLESFVSPVSEFFFRPDVTGGQ